MQLCRCNVNCLPQSVERVVIHTHAHTRSTGPSKSVGVKLMAIIALLLSEVARTATANLGYTSIKPEQELAIVSFLWGNNVFVSLLTRIWQEFVLCGSSLCLRPAQGKLSSISSYRCVPTDCLNEGPSCILQCQRIKGWMHHQ